MIGVDARTKSASRESATTAARSSARTRKAIAPSGRRDPPPPLCARRNALGVAGGWFGVRKSCASAGAAVLSRTMRTAKAERVHELVEHDVAPPRSGSGTCTRGASSSCARPVCSMNSSPAGSKSARAGHEATYGVSRHLEHRPVKAQVDQQFVASWSRWALFERVGDGRASACSARPAPARAFEAQRSRPRALRPLRQGTLSSLGRARARPSLCATPPRARPSSGSSTCPRGPPPSRGAR